MEAIDPTTQEGMRILTLRAVEFCRKELETSGDFEQHFGLRVGSKTEDFKLSTWAAASSLTRIFEEAHKEAQRAHANTLILMLRRPMASLNRQLALELWDSILVVTQTERRTAIAMLPFRKTNAGLEFAELQKGECETETVATPQVIFQNLGYVADARALDDVRKGRGRACIWN
ncbi:MAG: hypothetical protein EPN47_17610 [Acidobacteria bacterium]|jgi:hypothetical protein|nr:MAG: hypothetical protein EPN47_17610 [Acidobacteriota bacterium]